MNSTSTRGPAGGTRQRLLEAAQRGDPAAQEELVRRFEPLVQRVVWKLRLPPGLRARGPRAGGQDRPAGGDPRVAARARTVPRVRGSLRHQPGAARTRGGMPAQASDPQPRRIARGREPAVAQSWTEDATRAQRCSTRSRLRATHGPTPKPRLLVREQLTSVRRALPTLTAERARRARRCALNGQSYERLGPALGRTRKAASQAAYRARRKLAAALTTAA